VGVGGIGMSALARYFIHLGKNVFGYDRVETKLTQKLVSEGIDIIYTDEIDSVNTDFLNVDLRKALVIYTPAIPKTNVILGYFNAQGYKVIKRSEALEVATQNQKTIAVAGTHGKTTTSAMVTHMLTNCHIPCSAFLGGIANNFESNIILNPTADYVVVEADEYDRSFLRLKPFVAIVTSTDADHLDIYQDGNQMHEAFQAFVDLVDTGGLVLTHTSVSLSAKAEKQPYGIDAGANCLSAENVRVESGEYVFELSQNGKILGTLRSPYPGFHNVENTVAAIGVALYLGAKWEDIVTAVATFEGVKRRFDYQIRKDDLVFIDDYAHHPTEIKACVGSVKALYPDRRITGVFQPHLYSRTRDFADDFAKSLEDLNDLLLMEIYPAREEPIEGVDSTMLLNKVRMVNKKLVDRDELVDEVLRLKPEVLLTMGAGDIDKMLEPLKDALNGEV
jgi:UDP-N-acetylmuramate--alanine ligase